MHNHMHTSMNRLTVLGLGFCANTFLCFFYCQFICVRVHYSVFCVSALLSFGCQYQCNRLPGKTRLQNDLLCVKWDVRPHTLTQLFSSFIHHVQWFNTLKGTDVNWLHLDIQV